VAVSLSIRQALNIRPRTIPDQDATAYNNQGFTKPCRDYRLCGGGGPRVSEAVVIESALLKDHLVVGPCSKTTARLRRRALPTYSPDAIWIGTKSPNKRIENGDGAIVRKDTRR